ncbi:HEAT domain containing protein [Oscillochloris trichoides DG-6]|uniref:HEAT domain containing protein n=1 Tax=Oscillochloris trichoides DG-6 TaxID=765420 RepID=E1IH93_9CHLR|nr:HEAT repeat domain-containing protein [Oscillochloris trichoides]EFO79568.1 HEAT domain containing protein [Oscillochloris trichoides DG-6]
MFDQEAWRTRVADRLSNFARNPRQDIQLAGTNTVLGYLAVRTLEPFLDAFQQEPVAAVLALAEIVQGSGADQIVRRASQMRYQVAQMIERELRTKPDLRAAIEQLIVTLNVLHLARQRLNSSRDEWLRLSLLHEIDTYEPGELSRLRQLLHDPGWQSRYETIRSLRQRNGNYSAADLVLLHDGLSDSASHVRSAAARMLGQFAGNPPVPLVKALTKVALYDCDLETRYAAARTLGALRDRIASPQLIDHLGRCLSDKDSFVRSAAALILGQFGELAGTPSLITQLTAMISDDDAYTREAAARTLGRIGAAAASAAVLTALTKAMEDEDANVHEAAVDALTRLRKIRATLPLTTRKHPTEPLPV